MRGFLKLKTVDFDEWNKAATLEYIKQTGDVSCTEYTAYKPDVNPDYVWARIEHEFIMGDTISAEDALIQGMRVDDEKPL